MTTGLRSVRAVLVDFYGSLVEEDDDVVGRICVAVSRTAASGVGAREVGRLWWPRFAPACNEAHGNAFRTQREIASGTLREVIADVGATADADELIR